MFSLCRRGFPSILWFPLTAKMHAVWEKRVILKCLVVSVWVCGGDGVHVCVWSSASCIHVLVQWLTDNLSRVCWLTAEIVFSHFLHNSERTENAEMDKLVLLSLETLWKISYNKKFFADFFFLPFYVLEHSGSMSSWQKYNSMSVKVKYENKTDIKNTSGILTIIREKKQLSVL